MLPFMALSSSFCHRTGHLKELYIYIYIYIYARSTKSRHYIVHASSFLCSLWYIYIYIAHIFRFVCINMEAYACCCSFQAMQKCFGLVRCICQYRYVIGVVGVGNCCCGISSASFLRQFEAILFDFVNRCSKYVV